jgi:predicted nuclease of predicted toxin-antitoxin system
VNTKVIFLLDTNVFIEAAKRYYAFDIAPGFWQALLRHAEAGHIISVDRVFDELERGKDRLFRWVQNNMKDYFRSTGDRSVLEVYAQLMRWGQRQGHFTSQARREFAEADNADPWLVAYAKAKRCVLVTLEKDNPSMRRKIPIPSVCQAFEVPYIDTFKMLRQLNVTFQ